MLNVLFARFFGAAASGEVFYAFAVLALAIQVMSVSMESGVAYYAAKEEVSGGRLLGLALLWSLVVTTVLTVAYLMLFRRIDIGVVQPSYAIAYVSGNVLIAFGNAYCYSRFRFVLPGMVAVSVNAALIAALLYAQYAGGKAAFIPVYFFSFLLHGAVLFIFLFFSLRIVPSFRISKIDLKKIFTYSLHAFAGNLLFLLMNRVDYFFVKAFCPAAELGNYIQASKVAQLFFLLPSMIASVLFPWVAAGGEHPVNRIRTVSICILIGYTLLLSIPAATGWWLFPLLYGKSFSGMYLPFLLLTPGILAISSLYPYTAYYAGVGKLRVNVTGAGLALVLILAGDALLIPSMGIAAAAMVSSAGYIVFQLYVMWVFKNEAGLPFKKLFLFSRQEYLYLIDRVKP